MPARFRQQQSASLASAILLVLRNHWQNESTIACESTKKRGLSQEVTGGLNAEVVQGVLTNKCTLRGGCSTPTAHIWSRLGSQITVSLLFWDNSLISHNIC